MIYYFDLCYKGFLNGCQLSEYMNYAKSVSFVIDMDNNNGHKLNREWWMFETSTINTIGNLKPNKIFNSLGQAWQNGSALAA